MALGRWLDGATIGARLREDVDDLIRRSSAPDEPTAFDRPAVVTWRDGASMIVVARRDADSRPCPHAVGLYRTTEPLDDGRDVDLLLAAVVARFQSLALAPAPGAGAAALDRVCVFSHGPESGSGALAHHPFARPYKRYLAASMEELLAQAPPPHAERVAVREPADLAFYGSYERMYEDFWATSPTLRDAIGIESRDDLETYRRSGGLRLVFVDDELAGLIGAIRHAELGLRGWRLRERVMADRFRGGGFATAALWRFVRDLRREPGDLVWGTIMRENQPSMRSALKLGRIDVGGLVWVGPREGSALR